MQSFAFQIYLQLSHSNAKTKLTNKSDLINRFALFVSEQVNRNVAHSFVTFKHINEGDAVREILEKCVLFIYEDCQA